MLLAFSCVAVPLILFAIINTRVEKNGGAVFRRFRLSEHHNGVAALYECTTSGKINIPHTSQCARLNCALTGSMLAV